VLLDGYRVRTYGQGAYKISLCEQGDVSLDLGWSEYIDLSQAEEAEWLGGEQEYTQVAGAVREVGSTGSRLSQSTLPRHVQDTI
jgi:hypothetical protein